MKGFDVFFQGLGFKVLGVKCGSRRVRVLGFKVWGQGLRGSGSRASRV